jgi:hypothetical protein
VFVLAGALLLTAAVLAPCAAPAAARMLPGPAALLARQDAELSDGQPAAYEDFGGAVALDGDTALVGAGYKPVGGQAYAGAAYVYVRSGRGWSLQAALMDPGAAAGDGFGGAVALDGDTALIGADNRSVDGREHAGAAYVYVRSGGAWSLQAELTASAAAANDWFGSSVALDGDTALIGAGGRTVGGQYYAGAAFVFARAGAVWSQQAELTAGFGAAGDEFGHAVALSGDTALVGAGNRTVGGAAGAGAAYVFGRAGAVWSQLAELTAPDAASRAGFGSALDLSGDTALIGAGGAPAGGRVESGAAYIYTRSGMTWSQQAQLTDPGGTAGDWFGCALALSGDRALIGAWGATVEGKSQAGAAYVFGRGGTGWTQLARVTASDAAYGDNLGTSLDLAGDRLLVGAPGKKVGGQPLAGAAYVFGLVPAPSVSLAASPTATKGGRPVTLSGVVSNAVAASRLVAIQSKVGSKLVLLKQLRLSSNGSFAWAMPVRKAGRQVLVATYAAGGASFQSAAVTVVVRK